jgi:hypothetical protein
MITIVSGDETSFFHLSRTLVYFNTHLVVLFLIELYVYTLRSHIHYSFLAILLGWLFTILTMRL